MKNLKKLFAVVVVVAMMATIMAPAFAAGAYSYEAEAQVLNDLGLYKGISTTEFVPDLGTALDRETGVVMLLRVFGLDAEAEAVTDADATLAKFSDAASISSWAKNSVAYAVENGIVVGNPDGTFAPKAALNGKAYCKMILVQLGYTPDYNNAPAELADKGGLSVLQAVKFTDKNLIKDDLVGISYGTLKAEYSDGATVIEKLVAANPDLEEAATTAGLVEEVAIDSLASVPAVTCKVGETPTLPATVTATYSDKTTAEVAVTWDAVDTSKAGTVTVAGTVEGTDLKASVTVTVNEVALAVESVKALNDQQVQFIFNKAMDSTAAVDKAYYKREGVALAANDALALQSDNKSVILTLAAAETNQTTKKFTVVNGIKAADASTLKADTDNNVFFFDSTLPTVVKAEQSGPDGVMLYFSEPMQAGAPSSAFKVDDGRYSATVGAPDAQNYTIKLTFGATLPAGSHTIVVNPGNVGGAQVLDAATLAVREQTVTVTMAADTTAPTLVSAAATSRKALELTFSEPLKAVPTIANVYHTSSSYTAGPAACTFKAGSNSTVVVVDFTTHPLPVGTAYIYVAKEAVQDLFSNKLAAISSVTATVVDDTAKPTIASTNVAADNKYEITWSEAVTGTTIASNYVLKDSAGAVLASKAYSNSVGNPIATLTYDATAKKTTIDFGGNHLPAGAYKLTVSGVNDTALVPNAMDSATVDFTITDTTAPTVTAIADLVAAVAPAGQKIIVKFSESMNTSILTAANYVLNGAALPDGTTIVAGLDSKSAIITLPAANVISDLATLQVGQVADAVGNKTALLATSVDIQGAASIPVQTYNATSRTSVTVEATYPLASINAGSFTVAGHAVVAASFENKALPSDGTISGAVITLAVADADKWATNATPTVRILDANAAKDSLGRSIATNGAGVAAADKIAPEYAKQTVNAVDYNDIQVNDAAGANSKLDQIVITYSESIKADTVSISTYEVAGYNVTDVLVAANVVTLTIEEPGTANTAAAPTVKQVLPIKDTAGNVKAAETDAQASLDNIVPTITGATVTTVDGASNDIVTVSFSEPMNETSAEAAGVLANITVTDGNAAGVTLAGATSQTLSEDGMTLTIVTNKDFNTNDIFTLGYNAAGAITDNATLANPVATKAAAATGTIGGAAADAAAPTYAKVASTLYTSVTLQASEALYIGGVAVADGADIKAQFTATLTGGAVTSAIYNATTKQIVFTISAGAIAGDTIAAKATLTDAKPNASGVGVIVTAGGAAW